jgi:hypothetical protein
MEYNRLSAEIYIESVNSFICDTSSSEFSFLLNKKVNARLQSNLITRTNFHSCGHHQVLTLLTKTKTIIFIAMWSKEIPWKFTPREAFKECKQFKQGMMCQFDEIHQHCAIEGLYKKVNMNCRDEDDGAR